MKTGAALWRAVIEQAKDDLREAHAAVTRKLHLLEPRPAQGRTARYREQLRRLDQHVTSWSDTRRWLFSAEYAGLCAMLGVDHAIDREDVRSVLHLPLSGQEIRDRIDRARTEG